MSKGWRDATFHGQSLEGALPCKPPRYATEHVLCLFEQIYTALIAQETVANKPVNGPSVF